MIYGAASMTPTGGLSLWSLGGLLRWIRLGIQYLSRPMVDPLQLPAENKAIFGFNLIWMFGKLTKQIYSPKKTKRKT